MRNEQNFIDGMFVDASGEPPIAVYNPATGERIAEIDAASAGQVQAAVAVAARAQREWRRLPAIERAGHLRKLADALVANAAQIGAALASESGKSLADASNEAVYAAEITRYHAEWARRIEGEVIPSDNADETMLLQREPLGVVACLIPFNYPVYTLMRKIAPALITGNTVVFKPSSDAPLSGYRLTEAFVAAGIPKGVLNLINGRAGVAEASWTQV